MFLYKFGNFEPWFYSKKGQNADFLLIQRKSLGDSIFIVYWFTTPIKNFFFTPKSVTQ